MHGAYGGRRRRAGVAESPEIARGRLTRRLFALYDELPRFRTGLRRLHDEHRGALAWLAERVGVDLSFDAALARALASPDVATYAAAVDGFASAWGLDRLGPAAPLDPAFGVPLTRPGPDAVHAWCVLHHANGSDGAGLPFGAGHAICSTPSGVDTTVRLGDFVDRWDPEDEPLADHEVPIPDSDTGFVHRNGRPVPLRALYGWRMHRRVQGATTRLRKAAERAGGRALTAEERASLDWQLARIEAEAAAVGLAHPDTAPKEDKHLRWTFQRLAPIGRDGRPLGVWQIALADGAEEKTVRNETAKIERRLGVERFPTAPRKPEHGPRSRSSR